SAEEVGAARAIASHLAIAIDRKRAEDAIVKSERQYRSLFENAHDAIVVFEPEEEIILDVNDRACSLYGFLRSDLIGRSLRSLSKDPQRGDQFRHRMLESGDCRSFETVHFTSDNREIFLEVNASFVNYKGRRAIASIQRDVTERKGAEAALRESEERFKRAFEGSPDPMTITTYPKGLFISVNDSFLTALGYERNEVIGRTIEELGMWQDSSQWAQMFELLNREGRVRGLEVNWLEKSGEIRTRLLSCELIELGGERCLLSVSHDITIRKRAEQQLRASEERFSKAFHANPNPMCIFSYREGKCLDANESCLRLLDYTRQEIVGRTANDIAALADMGEQIGVVKSLREGAPFRRVETHLRNKTGQILTVVLAMEIIELGNQLCVLIAGSDVTDRKRAEHERNELLASERLARQRSEYARQLSLESLERERKSRKESEEARREWQTTLDMMADMVTVVGLDDRLIRANTAFYRSVGLTPEQCVGKTLKELVHGGQICFVSDPEKCPVCTLRSRRERGVLEVPAGVISEVPFLASVDPIVNGEGETIAMGQVVRDLCDLYKARKDAERERVALNDTIEQMADGLIVFDRSAGVVRANRHAEDLFGFSREAMINDRKFGLREDRFFTEDGRDVDAGNLPVNRALQLQKTVECRGWYLRPDGRKLLLAVTVSPLFDGDQGLVGAIALFRDVTLQQRKRERELQADKLRALGQLASGVAHNLNNALAAVLGYTQLSLPKIVDPEVARYLEVVEKSAKDAARMVERIQNFARARADRDEFVSIRILDVVRDAIEITKPRWRSDAESRGIKYEVRLAVSADEDVMVRGEPSELREVFVNLILNALDAMPDGGRFSVHGSVTADEITLSFVDTGTGMPQEIKDRIFEPFFTTKGVSGLGMGLSESYRIIERHGGRIDVETELQSGSAFHIRLPLGRLSETGSGAHQKQTVFSSAKVLIIDDEEPVRTVLSTMLSEWGHQVSSASSAEEALKLMNSQSFDLVFTDLAMPKT